MFWCIYQELHVNIQVNPGKKLYPYYLLGYNEENIPGPQCFDSYSNSNIQKNDKFFNVDLATAYPTKTRSISNQHSQEDLYNLEERDWKENHCQGQRTSLFLKWKYEDLSSECSITFNSFIIRKQWDMISYPERNLFKPRKLSHKLTSKKWK